MSALYLLLNSTSGASLDDPQVHKQVKVVFEHFFEGAIADARVTPTLIIWNLGHHSQRGGQQWAETAPGGSEWGGATMAVTISLLTPQEALELEVIEKRRHLLGEDCQYTLRTMRYCAHLGLGKLQETEAQQVLVLEESGEGLGEDHPDTLQAMGNVVVTYYKLGQFLQAEELCAGALEKHKKLLGEHHPDTIRTMHNLALTYRILDKVPKAEEMEKLVAYHEV
ncbi:hypothetical protein B0H19DRAFT_1258340 [Mycena capillaripes]|nr:hypothetical protein B0H19DRAFT_1258340 [Mycena capillaripes]